MKQNVYRNPFGINRLFVLKESKKQTLLWDLILLETAVEVDNCVDVLQCSQIWCTQSNRMCIREGCDCKYSNVLIDPTCHEGE